MDEDELERLKASELPSYVPQYSGGRYESFTGKRC
jgi:hypothetical protein